MPGKNLELSISALEQRLATLNQPGEKTPTDGEELPAEVLAILIAHLKELELARKQIRQQDHELLAARRRYESLFEFTPDGYIVTDALGVIRETNRAAATLFDIPPDYLVGKPLAIHIASKQRALFRQRLNQLKKPPQTIIRQTWELDLQPRKGLFFPVLLTLMPRYSEKGELVSINWLVQDITAMKQAEKDLRASTEFNRAILNSLDAHIAVLNKEGEIIAINEGWERFARENGDPTLAHTGVGINYLDVCRRARGEFAGVAREALAGIRAVLNGSQSHFTFEYPCPAPTKLRWFVMYATALAHEQGGGVISHVNITERKQVEEEMLHLLEEIHRQRAQLRALTRRLGEVQEAERKQLAGELHDQVGQKLTALDLNLNIIRARLVEAAEDSLVQAKLDDSLILVEETATSIRDVMATLRPPMLDDYGLAATLRWYGAQMAKRGGFTLTVHDETASPHLPSTVENILFRIAQEALTNVVKHAQASAVTIRLEQDNGLVRMIVADNGRGFERAKLFETRNWSRWGLMTMAERAEAAGGRCRVESHPNQGTKIIVEVRR